MMLLELMFKYTFKKVGRATCSIKEQKQMGSDYNTVDD